MYHINRANDHFLLGKEYLTQMVILSKCNCLLASQTSATPGVLMMTEGFENAMIFNLGTYNVARPLYKKYFTEQTPSTKNAADFFFLQSFTFFEFYAILLL